MNDYYIGELGKVNKERYIDTSTIMNTKRLAKFIEKAKESLIANNIKIKVSKPVIEELTKHSLRNDETRKRLAIRGLQLISENKEIFEIEGLDEEMDKKVFADKELLATIMNNRSSRSQMLITNDKNLAIDAYKINNLKSVNGGVVYVCYIDEEGELQKSPYESDEIKEAEIAKTADSPNNNLKTFGLCSLIGSLSYVAGKHGDQILDFAVDSCDSLLRCFKKISKI